MWYSFNECAAGMIVKHFARLHINDNHRTHERLHSNNNINCNLHWHFSYLHTEPEQESDIERREKRHFELQF
jgi:hypothetical protein